MFGVAIFGTLLGPIVGTLAVAIGTEVVFAGVGALALALVAWTLRHPEPPRPEREQPAPIGALMRRPKVLLCLWLFLLEALMVGATGTLLPLRLSHLGASGVAIGIDVRDRVVVRDRELARDRPRRRSPRREGADLRRTAGDGAVDRRRCRSPRRRSSSRR